MVTAHPLLGIGWDRLRGWQDQYDRVLRWHTRLLTVPRPPQDPDEGCAYDFWDTAFAFFQNAHHLKDWIAFERPDLRDSLETLINSDHALRIGADICNGTKHREVTHGNRQPGHLAAARAFTPWDLEAGQEMLILGPRGPEPVLPLADRCLGAWREYITQHLAAV